MGITQRMASGGDIASKLGIVTPTSSFLTDIAAIRAAPPIPVRAPYRPPSMPSAPASSPPVQRIITTPQKADVGGAILESVKNSAIGLVFPPSLLVTYPNTIDKVVTEAEKEDPVLALKLKEIGEAVFAGGSGLIAGVPGVIAQTIGAHEATEDYREELVEKYPDIPILQQVSYTLPEIKIPEINMPDFSGIGKWLLIAGGILAAIMIIPALLSRRRA